MDIELGRILLYTRNQSRLVHFFSQVFDAEVSEMVDGAMQVKMGDLKLYILPFEGKNLHRGGVEIELKVDDIDRLHAFLMKAQFYYYRSKGTYNLRHMQAKSPPELEIIPWQNGQALDLRDPDGRIWKLKCAIAAHEKTDPAPVYA